MYAVGLFLDVVDTGIVDLGEEVLGGSGKARGGAAKTGHLDPTFLALVLCPSPWCLGLQFKTSCHTSP